MRRFLGLPGFLLCATLLVAALFGDAFVSGRVLSQADILFDYVPWSAHRPPGFTHPGNDLLSDIPQVFYPFLMHAARSLRAWTLPLWSPALFAGHPFLASFQSATFSPFTLPALLLSPADALLAAAMAKLLVGGLGMWLFLRRLGLSSAAVWFGAVAYLLNPFSVVWIEHPVSAVSAWLPWLLWGAERLLASRAWRDVALLAVLLAVVVLAGHPETSYKVLLLGGAYVIAGLWHAPQSRHSRAERLRAGARALVARFAPAALLGLLLTSIQVLPFAEYLRQSFIWQMRSEAPANVYPAPASTLVTAVVPNFFGNPSHRTYVSQRNRLGWVSNFCEQQLYPGIVTWVLAAVGLAASRRHWRAWFFAAAGVVGALVMVGTPVVTDALLLLPGARVIVLTRFGLLTIVAAIVLAAYGVEALTRPRPGTAAPAVAPALAIATLAVAATAGTLVWARGLLASHQVLAQTWRWSGLALLLLIGGVTLVWLRTRGRLAPSAFATLAIVMVGFDLFVLGWRFHPMVPRSQLFPVVPEIALVAADPGLFRVVGIESALLPNAAMTYGLQDLRGYDGMMPAVHGDLLGPVHKGGAYRVVHAGDAPHLLDLLNVKYVFAGAGVTLPAARFTRVYASPGSQVFRNERAYPRAFLVGRARVVTPAESLRLMRAEHVDLRREALLHEPLAGGAPLDAPTGSPGTARVVRYEDSYVEIETEADGRRLLVLGDLDYPGWYATVDDAPARIARANRGLRAVPVAAGRHTVRFGFAPRSVRYGAWLSLAGAIAIAALLVVHRPSRGSAA